MWTETEKLAFGVLPACPLDDDHEANSYLDIMSYMEHPKRRARFFAASARAFAKDEARGDV